MVSQSDRAPSSEEIRSLRGPRSRAEFGALLDVTGLTVYRWELPAGAAEARRPRGAVLARLLQLIDKERAQPSMLPARSTPPSPSSITSEERAALAPALGAMDEGQLEHAEAELVALLASGGPRSDAARALASIMLARIQLFVRHDTRSAFATLLAASTDLGRLPGAVQLEYHVTAANLHAHSDAHLFNPGKTNHHVTLAEALMHEGRGDHRFLLWFAQFAAAVALYEVALIARAMEGFAAVRDLATTTLHRCLAEEAATVARLGLSNSSEAARQIECLRTLTASRELPMQQTRARIWRAEILVEEGAAPSEILALIDEAEQLQRRHRVAIGTHTMLMTRNRGEALLRLGDRRTAEHVLLEATRVATRLAYTPLRIHTTLARLYLLADRADELTKIVEVALAAEDAQKELSRGVGRVLDVVGKVYRGDAAADWCSRLLDDLAELRRLGVWPVPYRHLVLLALGVAASRGAVSDAERLLVTAERAIEWSASPSASATYRRHRATVLMRRGRSTEARRSLEAALATFESSGDVVEAALAHRALANIDLLEQRPEAEARIRATGEELASLEIPAPPLVRADAVYAEEEPLPSVDRPRAREIALEALLVPLQRLATRGVGASFLQKELVTIITELLPGRHVRLEHVDGAGAATGLDARGEASSASTWFDVSDGAGRRLRLGVGDGLHVSERAAVEIVLAAASMAFEISALRGFTAAQPERSESAASDGTSVPIADFVAASPSMRRIRSELGRLSGSRATIIVTGESGTGKEVVARAIHSLSRRSAAPYVTFNSAAVPRELFESQLFGHKRGSFTGATTDHAGVIRAADGGTLFLDEIGELPLDVQPKLLRFLENGEVLPLGERKPVQVDVRVIAATHRDLLRLVREGKFREDLYYRLQVIPVHIPPLRERRDDVIALARHFMRRMTPEDSQTPMLSPDGEAKLLAHSWPGNVRELRNVIERCMAFDPLPRLVGATELRIDHG